jgi:small subunit ribosomal protein S21
LEQQGRAGRFADEKGAIMQVLVRDNNVDQALRVLKKKMQREGIFREMKQRRAYEKPSERKTREKAEAIRRARKQARKLAQREGLIPMPKKVERPRRGKPGSFGPRPPEAPRPVDAPPVAATGSATRF